jgi:hypothetical protein
MVCPHMGLIPLAFLSNGIDPYEGQSEKKQTTKENLNKLIIDTYIDS